MRVIAFTDIDDTLMQTGRKVPSTDGLAVGATSREGLPSSFMTLKQQALWALLMSGADRVIPVTARSVSALSRVKLPFCHEAVTDFGAAILAADGTRDAEWHARIQQQSEVLGQADLFTHLMRAIPLRHPAGLLKSELRLSEGISCFVSFRATSDVRDAIRHELEWELGAAGVAGHYYFHITDRDVTLLPNFIRKDLAVARLVEQGGYADDLTIGLGDSLTDVGFMSACDLLAAPSASRVAKALVLAVGAST